MRREWPDDWRKNYEVCWRGKSKLGEIEGIES
jgi:hypothetical protein